MRVAAAVAARTTRLRRRRAIVVCPFRNDSRRQRISHAAPISVNELSSSLADDRRQRRDCRFFYSTSSSSSSVATTAPHKNLPSSNKEEQQAQLIPFVDGPAGVLQIQGQESHTAIVRLQRGQVLRAEAGAMLFMSDGVVMDTTLQGMSSALTRVLTGQNLFLTDFRYEGVGKDYGEVGLGTDFPSKILRFRLDDFAQQSLICQRGALLASNGATAVQIETEFTKSLTAGFFGGQGFILQRLTTTSASASGGGGEVLIKGGGTIVHKRLKDGEKLRVSSGSIVAFEPTVQYDVQMMPGIKNAMFGGEGLFLTTLTGPGQVWLQGMPPDRMIAEIARRVPSGGPGIGLGVPIMGGGSGGGEGGADAAGAAGAAADEAANSVGGGEEMVAATDQAVNADRQATVAASGIGNSESSGGNLDADSPSALFGDAAVPEAAPTASSETSSASSDPGFADSNMDKGSAMTDGAGDDAFSNDFSTEETSFNDDNYTDFSSEQQQHATDGDLVNDAGESISDVGDGGGGGNEEGSSIFQTLWDFFSGRDE
jgi:uncharacterized protein (TIGR00266 family)